MKAEKGALNLEGGPEILVQGLKISDLSIMLKVCDLPNIQSMKNCNFLKFQ